MALLGSAAAANETNHGSGGDCECDRLAAAWGCDPHAAEDAAHHSHNTQLILLALPLMLVGGGAVQHYLSWVPLPYTCLLLLFGCVLGTWVLFDPNFTLQPGTKAGDFSWTDSRHLFRSDKTFLCVQFLSVISW